MTRRIVRSRALVPAVVLALLVLLPPAARAGEPPTLGGTLGATPNDVIFDSSANVAVDVTLTAPKGWQLAETRFSVRAGGHYVVQVITAGESGQIIAVVQATAAVTGTDKNVMVLALGTPKPAETTPPWWWLLAASGVVLLVLAFIVPKRRFR